MFTGSTNTFLLLLLAGVVASANVNRITYQGRILKPDGSPVRANTSFRFVIKSPNACTLWQEDQLIDLTESNGAFSAIIGGGTNSAAGSHTFLDIFDNTSVLNGLSDCTAGGTYTAGIQDSRTLHVVFDDGTGPQNLAPMSINNVPFAQFASTAASVKTLMGKPISSLASPTLDGQILEYDLTTDSWIVGAAGAGVTSVALDLPSGLFAVGAPVVSSGTLTATLINQAANAVFAGPLTGGAAAPTFRTLGTLDIPSLDASKITSGTLATSVLGNVPGANGGTVTQVNSGTGLTGGPISGVGTLSLANTAVSPGVYGSANYSTTLTVDQQGRLTAAGSILIAISANQVTGGTINLAQVPDLDASKLVSGTLANARLPVSGVTAGAFSSSSYIPSFTVDSFGRLVSVGSNAISFPALQWTNIALGVNYASGSVGIGQASPATKLDVNGAIRIANDGTACAAGLAGAIRYNAGFVEYCNGTGPGWQTLGISGSGVQSLNGLTANAQLFAVGSAGTLAAFTSGGSLHTLNIPLASTAGAAGGLLSNADYLTLTNGTIPAARVSDLDTAKITTGTFAQARLGVVGNSAGGTGLNTSSASAGQILIGTGSGFALGTLSAGSNININNQNGTITISSSNSGGTVTQVNTGAGLVGGPFSTVGTISLGTSGVSAGNYGSASQITTVAVDQYGRVTSAATVAVAIDANQVTSGTFANARLPVSGVTAGAFSSSTYVPSFTVDAYGRLVTVGSNAISFPALQWTNIPLGVNYASGSVGIGQASPVAMLDVAGAIRIANDVTACTAGLAGAIRYNAGFVEYCNGTGPGWQTLGISGSGVQSLNGLTANAQLFTVGSAGTLASFTSGGSLHTLNIPLASTAGAAGGLLSNADYLILTNGTIPAGRVADLDASKITTGTLGAGRGGTGVDGSAAAQGQLLIGTGSGYTLGTLINGSGISIVNQAGSITISATNSGTVTQVNTGAGLVGGPISGVGTISLGTTGIVAGSVGSASYIPQIVYDIYGRITSVGSTAISVTMSALSGTLGVSQGGTGLDASSAVNGSFLIGNGTGFTLGTLVSSNGVLVATGAGSVGISTNAQVSNTFNTIVTRDGSGNFAAGQATLESLRLNNAGSQVTISNPLGAAYSMILPGTIGTPGQVLSTNGTSQLSWTSVPTNGGIFLAASGSAAVPGFAFQPDTDTGLWNPGANTIAISTAGTTRLTVSSLGRVGIGTDTPSYVLDVSGSFNVSAGNFTYLTVAQDSFLAMSTSGLLRTNGANTAIFSYGVNQNTGLQGYNDGQYSVLIQPNGGSVGVGTTSPQALFDVAGSSRSSSQILAGAGTVTFLPPLAGTTSIQFPSSSGTAGQVLSTNGTGSLSWTAVPTNGGTFLAASGSDGTPGFAFSADPDTGIYNNYSGAISFSSNGDQRFTIDPGGLFGAAAFIASGTGSVSSPTYSFLGDNDTGIYNPIGDQLLFATAGTNRISILANGNLGIGTSAVSPGNRLEVTGGAIAAGNGGELRMMENLNQGTNFVAFKARGTLGSDLTWLLPDSLGASGQVMTVGSGGTLYWSAPSAGVTYPLLSTTFGSVATPAYSFSADPDSGIYSPGIGSLAFSTNGTNRINIDSSGNVGIGTSSPDGKLQVSGTPVASGSSALLALTGNGSAFAGGSPNGNMLGINASSAYTGNLLNLSVNGVPNVEVRGDGSFVVDSNAPGGSQSAFKVVGGIVSVGEAKTWNAALDRFAIAPFSIANNSGTLTSAAIELPDDTTGTGALTGLRINKTGSGTGSGPKRLIDLRIDNVSQFTVDAVNGNVGIGTTSLGLGNRLEVNGGAIAAGNGGELRMMENLSNGTNFVAFRSSANLAQNYSMFLPGSIGTPGQVLTTDGTGNLSWSSTSGGASNIDGLSDGRVVDSGTDQESIFLGTSAGAGNTTGDYNIGIGAYALQVNTNGASNIAIGDWSLKNLNGGSNNIAIGVDAGLAMTSSVHNTGVGDYALRENTGNYNTVFGSNALRYNTSGGENVAIGAYAGNGVSNNSRSRNVYVGAGAGEFATTGGNNVFVGYSAGSIATSGSFNIVVGSGAGLTTGTSSNSLNIGNTIYGNLSNDLVGIGGPSFGAQLFVTNAGSNTNELLSLSNVNNGFPVSIRLSSNDNGGTYRDSYFGFEPVSGTNQSLFAIGNVSANLMVVRMDGKVGIGTTAFSSIGNLLEVSGGAIAAGNGGELRMMENLSQGTNFVAFRARGTLASDLTWLLPDSLGTSGQVMTVGTGGTLYWSAPSGGVTFPLLSTTLGSVGTPVYSFSADSDTGMFSPGVGTLAFSTNGTNRINIDLSGNVGIGTSSPVTKLDINGAIAQGGTTIVSSLVGSNNLFIGKRAGFATTTSGANNLAVGNDALSSSVAQGANMAIGHGALRDFVGGGFNTTIGFGAAQNMTGGWNNVLVGSGVGPDGIGEQNVIIGSGAGAAQASGNDNTYVGYLTGANQTGGSNNILVGSGVNAPILSGSYQLNIGNLIYGDLSTGAVGLGTTAIRTGNRLEVIGGAIAAGNGGELRMMENLSQGTNFVALKARGTLTSDLTWLLPDALGTSGQVMTVGNGGTLYWSAPSAGVTYPLLSTTLGSVATPAYSFVGSTDTGLFMPGSGTLAVTVAGSRKMTFGPLGIGIGGSTTPSSALEIYQDNGVGLGFSGGTGAPPITVARGAGNFSGLQLGYWSDGTNDVGGAIISSSNSAGDIIFATRPSSVVERVRITNGGSVGIGTSAPTAKFSVGAAATENAQFFYDNADVADNANGQRLSIWRRAAEGDRKLDLYIDEFTDARLEAPESLIVTGYDLFLASQRYVSVGGYDDIALSTRGTVRMYVDPMGNIGLGTIATLPGTRLQVMGGAITAGNGGELRMMENLSQGTNFVAFKARGTLASDLTWLLPDSLGSAGQVMTVGSGGTLYWSAPSGGVTYPLLSTTLGSVATPVFSFSADSDTGLFSPGAGSLAVTTNGTTRMTITDSGMIGIGTSTPEFLFDIRKTYSSIPSYDTPAQVRTTVNLAAPTSNPLRGFISQISVDGTNEMTSGENAAILGEASINTPASSGTMKGIHGLSNTYGPGGGSVTGITGESAKLGSSNSSHYGVTGISDNYSSAGVGFLHGGSFSAAANSGTTAQAYGLRSAVSAGAGAVLTQAYGLYTEIINTGGAPDYSYGLYIGGIVGTEKWSIYSTDATAPSYIAGSVGIGTTAVGMGNKLEVTGGAIAAGNGGELRMMESLTNGTNSVAFRAPTSLVENLVWSLPATGGTVGQALALSASGSLGWISVTAGNLINFAESVNTAAPNNIYPVVSLTAVNAAATVDIAFSPKGGGALTSQVANSAVSGGDKRGRFAVDWQSNRVAADQVASGDYSVISGGAFNRAPAQSSFIGGGESNLVDSVVGFIGAGFSNSVSGGPYNVIVGGNDNTITGSSGAILGGERNEISGDGVIIVGGSENIASGTGSSILGGFSNNASGNFSLVANTFTSATSFAQSTFGHYNSTITGNASMWIATDPLFVIGNGTTNSARSNAMTVLKNGNIGIGANSPTAALDVQGLAGTVNVKLGATDKPGILSVGVNNEIWTDQGVNGFASLDLNYRGYNGGFTQPRSFQVFDGQQNSIASFNGGNRTVSIGTTSVQAGNKLEVTGGAIAAGNGGELRMMENLSQGTNFVAFKARGTLGSDLTWLLPDTIGTAGNVMTVGSGGTLYWSAPSGSVTYPLLSTTLGSIGTPAYSFNADSDTGMYSPGTGTLAFTTNGTSRINIASNGNVGIGTTTPSTNLDIVGTLRTTASLTVGSSANPRIILSNNSGIVSLLSLGADSGTASIETILAQPLYFSTDSIERMRIDSLGRVGIGTSAIAAGAIMEITGTGTAASSIIIPRDTTANRPLTGVNGMIRYNTTANAFEGFQNGAWAHLSESVGTNTDALSNITVDFSTAKTIEATAVAGACGTLTLSGMVNGSSYTLAINNSNTTCSNITHTGLTVKTPSGYTAGAAINSGIVYTFIRIGNNLWVSSVDF